jgi:hypothetical protein
MSQSLDCRYTAGDRRVVRLTADLDNGWQDLGEAWGFDGSGFLNYEIGVKFQCRLRFVARAPETWETRKKFPASEYITRLAFGTNGALLSGSYLYVDIPLDQPWRPGESEPDQPSVYSCEPSLFSAETADGKIEYKLEAWAAITGPTKRFVRHKYDWGEGFAWVGSRLA